MYTIVVGVDENEERASAQAREILAMPIDPAEVRVTVLHAFQANPAGASVAQVGAVRRFVDLVEEAGFEVELEEAGDDPAPAITALADEVDADLIVLGGRKRTPTGKVLFGSITQAVILETSRAVLVCSTDD
jgi:nucleotide-binding universal stress UspA family protein